MCGDLEVNNEESCDGSPETSKSAICSAGPKVGAICSTNADCSVGVLIGVCGGGPVQAQTVSIAAGPSFQSCEGKTVTDANGVARQTQHVRACNAPGSANQCKFQPWSACTAIGACGDGIKDAD
jgi:hypothetical protein